MAGDIRLAVEIIGAKRLQAAISRASLEARARVAKAVQVTAEEVAQSARLRVPVRTGELRNTIRTVPTPDPFSWIVSAGFGSLKRRSRRTRTTKRRRPTARQLGPVPPGVYAMVVEFGSRSGRAIQPARPYLFPALQASRIAHLNRLRQALIEATVIAGRAA